MAITERNIVKIADVVDYFNQQSQSILNQATYHSGSYPHFTGTCSGGTTGDQGNASTYLTDPQALPDGQLAGKSIGTLSIAHGIINAGVVWTAISNIAKTFNKVRRYSSTWQHKQDSTWQNMGTVTGCAVFDTNFPAVPTGTDTTGGKSTRWERSGENVTLDPSAGALAASKLIDASDFVDTVNNCYNEWHNKCFNSNTLNYTMYTCHANCHNQCYVNRNRR